MEDTKSLLIMVLQKVFHNRPKVIEDTYQLIYSYNNGNKEKDEYEKTLKTICDLMNDELPSEILVYLLTLVDMPQQDGLPLPIVEKMQKTHNCLPERVRPHLLEYLRNCSKKPTANVGKDVSIKIKTKENCSRKVAEYSQIESKPPMEKNQPAKVPVQDNFAKPMVKKPRKRRLIAYNTENFVDNFASPPGLLDITANYVIKNEIKLKEMYRSEQNRAWEMIYSNCFHGNDLIQCYNVVKDLNKKTKLLRMIESGNITADIFFDEYEGTDVFLKERHMMHLLSRDPFKLSLAVEETIDNALNSK